MFLYEQAIHLILRNERGVYGPVGVEWLKENLAGYLPMVGDRFTNIEHDHIHTYEVIARHNVHDVRYNERRWFLIVRDIGNTAEHEGLATCMRDISDRHAKASREQQQKFHSITSGTGEPQAGKASATSTRKATAKKERPYIPPYLRKFRKELEGYKYYRPGEWEAEIRKRPMTMMERRALAGYYRRTDPLNIKGVAYETIKRLLARGFIVSIDPDPKAPIPICKITPDGEAAWLSIADREGIDF